MDIVRIQREDIYVFVMMDTDKEEVSVKVCYWLETVFCFCKIKNS